MSCPSKTVPPELLGVLFPLRRRCEKNSLWRAFEPFKSLDWLAWEHQGDGLGLSPQDGPPVTLDVSKTSADTNKTSANAEHNQIQSSLHKLRHTTI